MTNPETVESVLAEMRADCSCIVGGPNHGQCHNCALADRLAAAHAAEVAERDARIERLFAANEQVMARAEAAERDARELRDAHKRLAGMWRAEANDLAFPDEDERPIVEAEDAMRRLHADQLDKAIATTEQADD